MSRPNSTTPLERLFEGATIRRMIEWPGGAGMTIFLASGKIISLAATTDSDSNAPIIEWIERTTPERTTQTVEAF